MYLTLVDDDPLTEYINANFIEVQPYLHIHFKLINKLTIFANYAGFQARSFGGYQTLTYFAFRNMTKKQLLLLLKVGLNRKV